MQEPNRVIEFSYDFDGLRFILAYNLSPKKKKGKTTNQFNPIHFQSRETNLNKHNFYIFFTLTDSILNF